LILAVGFGGGLLLAKTAAEPAAPSRSVVDRLPPARIILPASAEAATPSVLPAVQATRQPPPHQAAAASETPAPAGPVKEAQQAAEKDQQAERAERRKAEAGQRARHRKYAERKARREAARLAMQQEQVSRQQPGIMAFGRDDGGSNFLGN
jgi:hypothetical protein